MRIAGHHVSRPKSILKLCTSNRTSPYSAAYFRYINRLPTFAITTIALRTNYTTSLRLVHRM